MGAARPYDAPIMTRSSLLLAPLLSFALLSPATARADVMPPGGCGSATDTPPCDGKKAGDACTFSNGNAGKCAALRCTNDAGQALLQCVATGAVPSGGCSAAAGATPGACASLLTRVGALALRRRRR